MITVIRNFSVKFWSGKITVNLLNFFVKWCWKITVITFIRIFTTKLWYRKFTLKFNFIVKKSKREFQSVTEIMIFEKVTERFFKVQIRQNYRSNLKLTSLFLNFRDTDKEVRVLHEMYKILYFATVNKKTKKLTYGTLFSRSVRSSPSKWESARNS